MRLLISHTQTSICGTDLNKREATLDLAREKGHENVVQLIEAGIGGDWRVVTFYSTWISKTMDFTWLILLLHGLYKLYEMYCPIIYSDVCYVNYGAIDPISLGTCQVTQSHVNPYLSSLYTECGPRKLKVFYL